MEKRYLTVEEVAKYLSLTTGTVYVKVCNRTLPHIKKGRFLRFNVQAINDWMEKDGVKEIS